MSSQPQVFEIDSVVSEASTERRVLDIAKVACLALAGASLTFGAIDIAGSAGDASALWHLRVRPALAAAIAGSDAEIQSQMQSQVIVKIAQEIKQEIRPEIKTPVQPAVSVPKRVRVESVAFASASPNDLRFAPALPSLDPVPSLETVPALVLVPLPRPAPQRDAETHDPTPAELLGLDINPKERAKSERCLANAVYFEARSEPVRGQMAVAQVVMNRVFSPFYPKDVCSVVYQNASRHLSCQFTFACDGKSKAIHDRGSWARAQRIAKQTLDGKLWINEVAKSTHYHAQYVRPNWIGEMRRLFKTGLHSFYRPYNWGDGSDEQGWVKATQTASVEPHPVKKKSR